METTNITCSLPTCALKVRMGVHVPIINMLCLLPIQLVFPKDSTKQSNYWSTYNDNLLNKMCNYMRLIFIINDFSTEMLEQFSLSDSTAVLLGSNII